MLDVVIIGSGPAGLSAAIYAKRANLDAVVLEKEYLGTGQIAYSSRVDNYPGLPGKDGYSLGEAFLEHAEGLGVTIEEAEVTAITKKEQSFVISCEDGKNIEAKTVVYAAGCQNRRLGVPGEEKLLAKEFLFVQSVTVPFIRERKPQSSVVEIPHWMMHCIYPISANRYISFTGEQNSVEQRRQKRN